LTELDDLIDLGNAPEINFTSFADCYRVGPSVRFVLFDWYKTCGVWRRHVTGIITRRSMVDFQADQEKAWRLLAGTTPVARPISIISAQAH
jgi:hypothetical protein